MAEDASERLPSLGPTVPTLVPSSFSSRPFNRKAELLSYLILCVAKMPFIPSPASGPTARERPAGNAASATAFPRGPRGDRGGGARERLASDLKQLAKKSQPRSFLPPAKAASGSELHAKGRGGPPAPSQTDGFPARGPEARRRNHVSRGGPAESEAEAKAEEEVRFTLALTPEAVLLLLRRGNSERRQPGAAGACGSSSDPRRPRKAQPATQRRGAQPGDISSIVKVSLLNERHKYDDVEYEEEEEEERQRGADEHVVMKCTEWLRGLESAAGGH
ncbi:proline-rich protein 18-like [Pungitius pungitius]|uniref:proline-rich protein 18-like n=1 Tax=Pungitius pungitius TaxID=134920 RepID=UPI002E0F9413